MADHRLSLPEIHKRLSSRWLSTMPIAFFISRSAEDEIVKANPPC
jgi:hypothetical protein